MNKIFTSVSTAGESISFSHNWFKRNSTPKDVNSYSRPGFSLKEVPVGERSHYWKVNQTRVTQSYTCMYMKQS